MPVPRTFSLVLGLVMIALGAFVAIRALWVGASLTRQPLLDVGFALFFLVRGALYLRAARRPAGPTGPR
ncbi:hypothetical protein [Roseisolibacter agri]|uniref:Uncharacterized protein n=1 Tax=Roseisolibacter agri TaxID=2014610 RepID=A0AA37VE24_9BACT|nr:hypothetical protein [Roseisolibacter agri]GLC24524.1 hypothetical protein rosag_10370 [Roseisolibacter agri]